MIIDLISIDIYTRDAELYKTLYRIAQQSRRVQKVVNHHRLVNVQLEIALRTAETGREIVAENLHRDHRERFALRWIYFARHDRRARLVFPQDQFTQTAARPPREPAHSVGDLHQ